METYRSLGLHCIDNVCHCDWRITIYDCVESKALRIVNILNISVSAFVSVIGIGLFIYRVWVKGHKLMEINTTKGFLRPKPVDCVLFFLTVYNLLRMLSSVILVADIAPDNMIFRSWFFEIGWEFGYIGFALYLIGIAQTLAESHKSIEDSWLPSPRVVDAVGFTFVFAPFIANNSASLAAGILANSNLKAADICTQLLYVFWFVHNTSLSAAVLFCGSRLVKTLNKHITKFNATGERYAKVQAGIFKIRAMMGLIAVCLLMFASFLLLYGILRDLIIKNPLGSVILSVLWHMLGPTTTLFAEAAIIFTPKKEGKSSPFGLKTSSAEKSSGQYDTQNSTKVNNEMSLSFQGTLSHKAFDDLSQQQVQYEHVFNKYSISKTPATPLSPPMNPAYSTKIMTSATGLPIPDADYHHFSTGSGSTFVEDQNIPNENFQMSRYNSQIELIDK